MTSRLIIALISPLQIVVPNFLKENSKARGSIYDREPRPRATSEKERRAISSPNLLISYRTKPAISDRLASLSHAKGSPSGTGKAYRTRSKGDLTVILNDSDSEVGNNDNDYQGWYPSETSSVASNDSARDRRSGRLSTTLDLTDELDSDSTDESRSPTPRRSFRARKRGSRTLEGEEIGPEIVILTPFADSQVPASPSSSRKRARLGSGKSRDWLPVSVRDSSIFSRRREHRGGRGSVALDTRCDTHASTCQTGCHANRCQRRASISDEEIQE